MKTTLKKKALKLKTNCPLHHVNKVEHVWERAGGPHVSVRGARAGTGGFPIGLQVYNGHMGTLPAAVSYLESTFYYVSLVIVKKQN